MSGAARRRTETRAQDGEAPPRHFLDLRDHDPATLRQMLDVASNLKRARRLLAPARRPHAGAHFREAEHAHPGLLRGGDAPARRRRGRAVEPRHAARPRRDGRRHRARAVALCRCDHAAHRQRGAAARAGGGRDRAGHQRPHRHQPSVPAHGRCDDVRGASRPDRGSGGGLVRRRQQRRAKLDRGGGAVRIYAAARLARATAPAGGAGRVGARARGEDRAGRRSRGGGARRALRRRRHLGR